MMRGPPVDPRQHINQPVHESASLSKLNQGPIQLRLLPLDLAQANWICLQ